MRNKCKLKKLLGSDYRVRQKKIKGLNEKFWSVSRLENGRWFNMGILSDDIDYVVSQVNKLWNNRNKKEKESDRDETLKKLGLMA